MLLIIFSWSLLYHGKFWCLLFLCILFTQDSYIEKLMYWWQAIALSTVIVLWILLTYMVPQILSHQGAWTHLVFQFLVFLGIFYYFLLLIKAMSLLSLQLFWTWIIICYCQYHWHFFFFFICKSRKRFNRWDLMTKLLWSHICIKENW